MVATAHLPRKHRSDGSQAGHALTFILDHSMGADQHDRASYGKRRGLDAGGSLF